MNPMTTDQPTKQALAAQIRARTAELQDLMNQAREIGLSVTVNTDEHSIYEPSRRLPETSITVLRISISETIQY